jgi:S-adenosyl-L-methionine hydrolase (adenosine-forming)
MGAPPVLTLLTDYGLDDEFVGVCHGVIARICPDARIIDLTHGIARHDIVGGALVLAGALPYLPVGIHVAVIDPGVGARRRAIALELADGRILVGPDNGILSPAMLAGGGAIEAVEISQSPLRLEPVSATFHGRDVFAPVAAHVAAGIALADAGRPLDPREIVPLPVPAVTVDGAALVAPVIGIDRFGNVQTAATHEDAEAFGLRLGSRVAVAVRPGAGPAGYGPDSVARSVRTFADASPGELVVYEDAARRMAVAVNLGSAAQRLRVDRGDDLRVTREPAG